MRFRDKKRRFLCLQPLIKFLQDYNTMRDFSEQLNALGTYTLIHHSKPGNIWNFHSITGLLTFRPTDLQAILKIYRVIFNLKMYEISFRAIRSFYLYLFRNLRLKIALMKIKNFLIWKIFDSPTTSSLPLESSCGLIIGVFTSYFLKPEGFKNPKLYYAHT